MKSIYTYYKERLVEISGKNRSLFSKKISRKNSFDIGRLFEGDYESTKELVDFLWKGNKYAFNIIGKDSSERISKNLGIEQKYTKQKAELENLEGVEKSSECLKLERKKREEIKRTILSQVSLVVSLKREIEEFEKETGRYELYVGYPFVQGFIGKDIEVKAPLVLFPVTIDVVNESTVNIEPRTNEHVQLNKVLILAYAQKHKLKNLEELETEFKSSISTKYKDVGQLIESLKKFGIKISYSSRKGLFPYEKTKEVPVGQWLEVKHCAVLGKYPLANSIYNDYSLLEKKRLTNDAIDELLYAKPVKASSNIDSRTYTVSSLDYAQQNAVECLNKSGNMVIYGPPGTGKSQTIVNIITDAIAKHKKVLVVSQKRAALDVVYNRLGDLNSKVMFLTDADKKKSAFYERVRTCHEQVINSNFFVAKEKYDETSEKLLNEENALKEISDVLFTPTEFGLSLGQMYASSTLIGKKSIEYVIYQNMLQNKKLLELNYSRLNESLRLIKEKNKAELYYKFVEAKKSNPFVGNIREDLEFHTINETKQKLSKILQNRVAPFDMSKYPNSRQFVAFFIDNKLKFDNIDSLVSFVGKTNYPKVYSSVRKSYVFLPTLPFKLHSKNKLENEIKQEFIKTMEEIKEYTLEYQFLQDVLTQNGYSMMIDNILNGNTQYPKYLLKALDNYVEFRDLSTNLNTLTEDEKTILKFAYKTSDTKLKYLETVNKIKNIRIYHEITALEDKFKSELSHILDYDNIKNRILSLKLDLNKISKEICLEQFTLDYQKYYQKSTDSKNYLYQISKTQNQWPIRKFMEVYGEYLYKLFPCWLLSPESVCTILPLVKNLFDVILFDEASQVFIENTLPVIYRGKNIVVAGDSKQLRPTAMFVKRFLGGDFDDTMDYSTQAALEVESLLDLAMTRYKSANLTYHYRSKNEELINFSNESFYEGKLQISPNITKNKNYKPIERIKVNGKWINRSNTAEANAVVEILKKIFATRKNNQSIGIITFNAEQESTIEDAIDKECSINPKFKDYILKEENRKENGEDISMFVKNLENVQGDERDIIIFSIGYARNELGRVVANFGPLSLEGGENRLNVAITRAKEKIYVVTSIEPEELNVDSTKNMGPKIFKNYLRYVRAVSSGNSVETEIILNQARIQTEQKPKVELGNIEADLKAELERLGYKVETNLGNTNYKISVAVYDKQLDRYLLGIECDYSAFLSSPSVLERDVFRPAFLKSRGWNIMRVWSRDYYLHKTKVLNSIVKEIGKAKIAYQKKSNKAKK